MKTPDRLGPAGACRSGAPRRSFFRQWGAHGGRIARFRPRSAICPSRETGRCVEPAHVTIGCNNRPCPDFLPAGTVSQHEVADPTTNPLQPRSPITAGTHPLICVIALIFRACESGAGGASSTQTALLLFLSDNGMYLFEYVT